MLTRSRLKRGEGELIEGDPEIGSRRAFLRERMSSPRGEEEHVGREKPVISETEFLEAFISMKSMMELLLEERAERKRKEGEGSSRDEEKQKGKGVGGDGDPPETNPFSSFYNASHNPHNANANMPLLKLDVKFELPMYNGELDAEKLDNWIKQIEVYCRIQQILDDTTKIQLATLRMGGTALIWWDSKTQEDLLKKGKIMSSWYEFTSALKKQFYPLGYMQQAVMDWQNLRQGKEQNVQEYTQVFRKRALVLGVPLYTQETLLKYIGGLHSHLRHSILMFNPSNLDEVCVQATHIEAGARNMNFSATKEAPPTENKKRWKEKKAATVRKEEGERPSCSHCGKKGHDDAKCWILHPELKPEWFKVPKGKQKATAIVQDLGSDSDDETKVTVVGLKGKALVGNNSSIGSSCASTSKKHVDLEDDKRSELFHIRVISKQTKIDTLIDSGSQVNLISEEIVKQLGLETQPHKKPYPLGWVCKDKRMQVTKQCTLKFAITSKFIDEVEFDVVPLDICGIVLGSPYLYDRKAIFYREQNQYHLFKEGIEYIVHSHSIKSNRSFVTTGQLKMVVNASKNLTLVSVKSKEESNPKHEMEVSMHRNTMMNIVPVWKEKHDVGAFSFTSLYSVLLFSFLLFSSIWLIAAAVNVDVIVNGINVLNNISAVVIILVMRQMYRFQENLMNDTGQVRQTCSCLNSE
jgi:hypothetical protein